MLKFDSNHESINESIKNNKKKIGVKNIIISGMLITSLFLFSGCVNQHKVDNDFQQEYQESIEPTNLLGQTIEEYVAMIEEANPYWDAVNYPTVDSNDERLVTFLEENNLATIEDSREKIEEFMSKHPDLVEYRYKTTTSTTKYRPYSYGTGFVLMPYSDTTTTHGYTTDPNHRGLTGTMRITHYVYYGYKIVEAPDGNLVAVKSNAVDDIEDLPEEYMYVSRYFYEKTYIVGHRAEEYYKNEIAPTEVEQENGRSK